MLEGLGSPVAIMGHDGASIIFYCSKEITKYYTGREYKKISDGKFIQFLVSLNKV
jgi:hypothetical protein